MNNIDELLRYDPIAEAEKITRKGHWSNFSEQDNMLALLLNIQHAGNKLHYFVRQIGKLKEKDPFIIRNNDWV